MTPPPGGVILLTDVTAPLLGAGAAGGTAYGLVAAWGSRIRPGEAWIAEATGLPAAISNADLVITGGGRFDSTSLTGKVVGNIVELAGGSRVAVVAGAVAAAPPDGSWAVSLTDLAGSADAAMAEPAHWLREAGRAAAARVNAVDQSASPEWASRNA
ncbi:MAG: glycerate kinase [Homoserinimonas sp.]